MVFESMSAADEPPDDLLNQARDRLKPPVAHDRTWPAVAAAAFFAVAALGFAVAAIMAPPLGIEPSAKTGVR
jgi:hypothetical protein